MAGKPEDFLKRNEDWPGPGQYAFKPPALACKPPALACKPPAQAAALVDPATQVAQNIVSTGFTGWTWTGDSAGTAATSTLAPPAGHGTGAGAATPSSVVSTAAVMSTAATSASDATRAESASYCV